MDVVGAIAAKRDGRELDPGTLRALVREFSGGAVPDYQMSAFLMAAYLRGLSDAETAALTQGMLESGERLDLSPLRGPTVDKHSTGGVGDGTTLVVAPLAAELGLQLLKLSGRGLGHTGGTLDKLESIPGMRTALSPAELLDQACRIGVAVGAQTAELVPADRMLYALRDVTATVGSTGLIASSVMSKKLAGGASSIVIDVKAGPGSFMKDTAGAAGLARLCVTLARGAGRAAAAVLSDMSQPLGTSIGNAIEVREAIGVLRGERRGRLRDLSSPGWPEPQAALKRGGSARSASWRAAPRWSGSGVSSRPRAATRGSWTTLACCPPPRWCAR
jgi:pyrimidine-nucleoside phosphorylase